MAYIVPPAVTRASSHLNLESALHSDTGLRTGYGGSVQPQKISSTAEDNDSRHGGCMGTGQHDDSGDDQTDPDNRIMLIAASGKDKQMCNGTLLPCEVPIGRAQSNHG